MAELSVMRARQASREPLYEIDYCCPRCGYEWQEIYESACDSECGECGLENITALDYRTCEDTDEDGTTEATDQDNRAGDGHAQGDLQPE